MFLTRAIVGSLASNCYIVGMALGNTGVGDANELSMMQSLDSSSAAIAHTRTKTTEHLVDNLEEQTLIRYACSDSLGNELLSIGHIALEVTVLRTLLHSLERTHTAICLKLTSVEDDCLTGRLFNTGKHTTEHNRVSTSGKSLNDIT